jgi:modulator of FtsH protease
VSGPEPEVWETFAVAQLGASAALLGLVFVGISINLQNVLASRHLVNRAAESVVLLMGILVASTAVLVPDQPVRALGVELLVLGLALVVAVVVFQRSTVAPVPGPDGGGGDAHPEARDASGATLAHAIRRVLGFGAGLLLVVAAASLLADGGGGLYWWAGSVVLAYGGALLGGWVLLIEILR